MGGRRLSVPGGEFGAANASAAGGMNARGCGIVERGVAAACFGWGVASGTGTAARADAETDGSFTGWRLTGERSEIGRSPFFGKNDDVEFSFRDISNSTH